MRCPNCHRHIKAGSKFCLHCGYSLNNMPVKHHSKLLYWTVGLIVVILLIAGGVWAKQYFTPARALSKQLPKSTWIESNPSKGRKFKKIKKGKKVKKLRVKSRKPKTHYSYLLSNGSELLSFSKTNKSTKIFNLLSENSSQGKKLRNNAGQNMKNVILQGHYTYHVKGNALNFKDGNSFRNVKKSKNGFTVKFYKGKKFLHTEHIKVYKALNQPIK